MPNVTIGNTAVTEVVPVGTTFTPGAGVKMQVNAQAGNGGKVNVSQAGNTTTVADAGSTNVASEITVVLDDSMSVGASGGAAVLTGLVIDS